MTIMGRRHYVSREVDFGRICTFVRAHTKTHKYIYKMQIKALYFI